MLYSFTPFALPYLLAFIIAGFISVYTSLFLERTRTNLLFVALSSSISIWIFSYLLEILATTLELMVFWDYIRFIGINLALVFFLLLALSFTSLSPKIFSSKLNILILFIPSILDYLLLVTNNLHFLYFEQLIIHPSAPIPSLYRVYGVFFLLHIVFSSIYFGMGIIALIIVYQRIEKKTFQRQIQVLLLSALIFIIVIIIYQFRVLPETEYLDITPLAFILAGPIFMFGISQYHLIDIVPLAHKVIISNLTNTGVIVTDRNNRIIEINPKAIEYLIFQVKKLIGKDLFQELYSQEHLKAQKQDIQNLEQIYHNLDKSLNISNSHEIQLFSPFNFEYKYLRVIVERLQEEKRPVGTIMFILDITNEIEIQKALQKREDLRDSLLGVLSHDLKNNLFVISGLTDIIRENLNKQKYDELGDFLKGIDKKVNEATSVISDVREYLNSLGSFNKLEFTKIDLKEILQSVIRSFKDLVTQKNIVIEFEKFPDKEVLVMGDLRIRSIFVNLIENAIKWSPKEGGKIRIIVQEKNSSWITKILDEGKGVPNELKKSIFKPFTAYGTEQEIGSGLGLALVSEILSSYNGEIWVEDNSPSGACFCVKIPIVQEKL